MLKKTIPGTDLAPSVICFGGGSIVHDDQELAFGQLDRFFAAGGSFIDTANVYGKWLPEATNLSEQRLGRWIHERGNRNRLVLATKGGHPDLATMQAPRLDRQALGADLEESLRALQTDVIDLYWLHRDDESRPVVDILSCLEAFVASGKIRWYGCSNWKIDRIRASETVARAEGWSGFVANQPLWSLAELAPGSLADPTLVAMDEAMWRHHRQTNWTAVPYSAQANGYFQKRLAGVHDVPEALRRRYDLPINDRRLSLLIQLAADEHGTVDELVLGYLLAQPFPVFPIIGPRTAAQLSASLKAGHRDWPAWLAGRLRDPGA
jgi:aryl-alcohol dehydrogenase-like predicted oxidoreductase